MNTDPFDLESLGQAPDLQTLLSGTTKPPRHRPGEWFLKGPIPWPWLEQAAKLPGKALAVSLVLWREAGRRRNRAVKICLNRIGLGVSAYAARRAVRSLEAAALVTIHRKPGRGLEVTINDAPNVGVPSTNGAAVGRVANGYANADAPRDRLLSRRAGRASVRP